MNDEVKQVITWIPNPGHEPVIPEDCELVAVRGDGGIIKEDVITDWSVDRGGVLGWQISHYAIINPPTIESEEIGEHVPTTRQSRRD